MKLTVDASAALADALSIEWGLRKLILRDCDLDDAVGVILRLYSNSYSDISAVSYGIRQSAEPETLAACSAHSGDPGLAVVILQSKNEAKRVQNRGGIHRAGHFQFTDDLAF